MNDPYGYQQLRIQLSQSMGVSLAYIETQWPDSKIRSLRAEAIEGSVPYRVDRSVVCEYCAGPIHDEPEELSLLEAAVNAVFVVQAGQLVPKLDATVDQQERVWSMLERQGHLNFERCTVARTQGLVRTS